MNLKCAICGNPVTIVDEKPERKCDCPPDTGIIADCSATVYGESQVADDVKAP